MAEPQCNVGWRTWWTCWLCWEGKIGVPLLLPSGVWLFGDEVPANPIRWNIGWVCYWIAVGCLIYGLIRDLFIIVRAVNEWAQRRLKR